MLDRVHTLWIYKPLHRSYCNQSGSSPQLMTRLASLRVHLLRHPLLYAALRVCNFAHCQCCVEGTHLCVMFCGLVIEPSATPSHTTLPQSRSSSPARQQLRFASFPKLDSDLNRRPLRQNRSWTNHAMKRLTLPQFNACDWLDN